MNNQSIKIFYHILAIENYKDMMSYQLADIKQSGLLDEVEKIFLIVNYKKEEDLQYIKNLCEEQVKIEILYSRKVGDLRTTLHKDSILNCPIEMGEGEGIFKMFDHAKSTSQKNRNDIYMFIHTKGVTDPPYHLRPVSGCLVENYEKLDRPDLCKKVLENMQTGLTSQWERHINKLNDIYSFYAYLWNFFWVRQDFLLNYDDKVFSKLHSNETNLSSSGIIKNRHFTTNYCTNLLRAICHDGQHISSFNSKFFKNKPHLNDTNIFNFTQCKFHFLPQLYKGKPVHPHKIGIYV